MDIPIDQKRRLTLVEYPAIVRNENRMLETLGGENTLNQVFSNEEMKLELNWHPKNMFTKAIVGDTVPKNALLMKVKIPKKKTNHSALEGERNGVKAEIVGIIDKTYAFTSLADCQYLPMERIDTDTNKKSNSNTNFSHTKQTGSATCMSTTTSRTADDWSCIAGHMSAAVGPPKDLPQYRSFSEDLTLDGTQDPDWLQKKTELYLPPPQFSCFDSPISCVYRDPPVYRRADYQAPVKTGHITVDRKRRAHFAISLNFDAPEVPNKPLPKALENMKQYGDQTVLETLQKMYESRPIWSRNALCHKLRVPSMDLRYLLPCVVYYFNTGPWRTLGIRLGYDPRKDINSKIYQIVDFRLTRRPQHILEQLRLETYNRYRQTSRVSTRVRQRSVKECHFRFSPSVLPGYKQMFYQLVEIDLQAVQDIVNENKGKEKNCTERDGWCVENYQSRCRVKMLDSLEPLIRSIDAKKEKKGEEDSGSSSDDYDDDEDEIEVREDASDQEEGEEEDDDDEEAEEDDEEEDEEDELHVRQDEILSDILSSMQTWQHGT